MLRRYVLLRRAVAGPFVPLSPTAHIQRWCNSAAHVPDPTHKAQTTIDVKMSSTNHTASETIKKAQIVSDDKAGPIALPPTKRLAILTCMDARINPFSQLGIEIGEAHIIRNAGGVARDALRSLIISQRLLGTREIAVYHHTGCGLVTMTTRGLQKLVKDADPGNVQAAKQIDDIDFLEYGPDLHKSVLDDVQFLKDSPLILKGTKITGWIWDVETNSATQVV